MKKKIEEIKGFGHSGLKITIDLNDEIAIALLLRDVQVLVADEDRKAESEGTSARELGNRFPNATLRSVIGLLSKLTTVSLPDANRDILEDKPFVYDEKTGEFKEAE